MTKLYAEVIGDPIKHSKSPVIHELWLEKLGIDAEYRKTRVRPADLSDFFARRSDDPDWLGCNVTIPHKVAVFPHLYQRDRKAAGIGAVNTIFRGPHQGFVGTNTDVDGVAEAVGTMRLAGRRAVVIGAGGAARAAFAFLAGQGCAKVRVLARSPVKAAAAARESGLAAEVLAFEARSGALDGAALCINATQLGMNGQDRMPGFVLDELAEMDPEGLVFDMVYAPLETDLLKEAASRNLRSSDGLAMLIGQAAVAFEKFFGAPAPREHDAELRAKLTS